MKFGWHIVQPIEPYNLLGEIGHTFAVGTVGRDMDIIPLDLKVKPFKILDHLRTG
ncbi:hypothetical protein SDC9_118810 [bioreactor metagenome]|uniref:Uncharacterized protein n=1 Tax=bioreactor metagenome TaxID=1076179 RepID=A0A645C2J6_9ZZZZ